MATTVGARATEEWEINLGKAIRETRLRQNRPQEEVARAANISVGALQNLERGQGSNLRTLVQVARALDHVDWLEAISPPTPIVSPMQLLRERRKVERGAHRRARRSRQA